MDITVFLGAPGSGKGTQAKILAKDHGSIHLSTGDMLRAAIQQGVDVGLKAKKFIDAGELVPDAVMIELIEKALGRLPSQSKIVLDGFPRTVAQAEALDKNAATRPNRAIYFMVPDELLLERLTGRRVCSKCGQPYHVKNMPPKKAGICDACGATIVQRPDDSESVVARRLEVFATQNQPLLDYFKNAKKLKELNANTPVDELQTELVKILS